MEKYDRIGKHYNKTRKADHYLAEKIFQHLAPHKKGVYLDIGCGTGNYTRALNQKGLNFVGVDPSTEMLKKANINSDKIQWKTGNSEHIPFENEIFEGVLASLTIHHWADLEKSFTELNRVLKPSGKFVIFTSTPEQTFGYWLYHYFPKMIKASAQQMPKLEAIEIALNENSFEVIEIEKYLVREDLEDLFLYSGKYRPEFYLNPQIRKGISSFSDLANAEEVASGLEKLNEDIESGRIKKIIENFENETGDYLFIVSIKAES